MNSIQCKLSTKNDDEPDNVWLDLTYCVFYSSDTIEHVQLDEAVAWAKFSEDFGVNCDVSDPTFQRRAESYFWDNADLDEVNRKIAAAIRDEAEDAAEMMAEWRRGA